MLKTTNGKSVYKNEWMEVFEDEIEFPNSKKGLYGFVHRRDGVNALVVNSENKVLLVKQYRHPIKDYAWELPGGSIDDDEDLETAIKREIGEETGLTNFESIEMLGTFYPLNSCSTEKSVLFLVKTSVAELPADVTDQDDEIFLERKFISIDEALTMIDHNEITDVLACNAIQILARKIGG